MKKVYAGITTLFILIGLCLPFTVTADATANVTTKEEISMTTKYIGEGKTVRHTAASTISSGDVVVMGAATTGGCCVGIALADIASGEIGEVAIEGVFSFTKVSGAVITQGDSVTWDTSASAVEDNAHTAATGDVENFGVAVEAAGSGVTTINVKLTPGVGIKSA